MPCWERRTTTLKMEKAKNGPMLDAFIAAGMTGAKIVRGGGAMQEYVVGRHPVVGEVTFVNGELRIYADTRLAQEAVASLRRGYTEAAFRQTAKRFGYQVTRNEAGKLVAERRSYGG